MADNIEFELDKDQENEEFEVLSPAQKEICSSPADDRVTNLYRD